MSQEIKETSWQKIAETRYVNSDGAAIVCEAEGWWLRMPGQNTRRGPFRYADRAMEIHAETLAGKITPAVPAIGDIVGYFHLKAPHQHHDNSFETASWWEDSELAPGIYPIRVGVRTYGRSKPLFLYAEGLGTVVDAFFPSSFGGNMFGGSNRERYVGNSKTVRIPVEIKKAIEQTGNSLNKDQPDIWVNPETWEGFAEYARQRLADSLIGFSRRHRAEAEAEQAGTTKHHAQWIAEDAELLESILRKIKSWKSATTMTQDLHAKNTAWVTEQNAEIKPA